MVISNIDPINAGLDDYEMARNAMDRIQKDLMSLCLTHDPVYRPPGLERSDDPDRFRFVSKTVSLDGNTYTQLRFACFEHIAFKGGQKSRIGIIQYYVEPSENGTMTLKRADIASVFFDETREKVTPNDPLLCERVNAFELTFIDQDGKSHEEWDSDDANVDFATPYAIQMRLVIKNKERSNNFATTIVLPSHREKNES
jgi:general secretion pathway protein J